MQPLTPTQLHLLSDVTGTTVRPPQNRVELRRYQISAGSRALIAQCVNGRVTVVDIPVDHAGRVYLLESDITSHAELTGLVDAYIEHSLDADRPAIRAQRETLDALTDDLA